MGIVACLDVTYGQICSTLAQQSMTDTHVWLYLLRCDLNFCAGSVFVLQGRQRVVSSVANLKN